MAKKKVKSSSKPVSVCDTDHASVLAETPGPTLKECVQEEPSEGQVPDQGTPQSIPKATEITPSGILERWDILEKVGEGGMSTVFKAQHKMTGQLAAVKALSPRHTTKPDALARFHAEAKLIGKLDHPHIVGVNDCAVGPDGQVFIVMDHASGESLAQLIKREGQLAPERALKVFQQVAGALSHAHRRGVIHRDLKPSNVMLVDGQDFPDYVKIVDFGIAKLVQPDPDEDGQSQHVTATGEVFGSPFYMSPEQYQGRALDARADIYAMGCLMYEALSGKPPFVGSNALETLYMHVSESPPALADQFSDSLLQKLEAIVFKCLAKDRESRYQSMEELERDLGQLAVPPPKAQPEPAVQRKGQDLASFKKRRWLALILVIGLALCAIEVPIFKQMYEHLKGPTQAHAERFNNMTREDYDRAIEKDPNNPALYYGRAGLYYYKLENSKNAVADLNKAIELKPDYYEAYDLRGNVLAGEHLYDQALADVNKAIEIEPTWSPPYTDRARINNFLERFDKAIPDCEYALKLNKKEYLATIELSVAYNGMERYPEAIDWAKRTLDIHPDPLAYNLLGIYHFHEHKFDQAIADEKNARAVDPGWPTVDMITAFAEAAKGDRAKAQEDVQKEIANDKAPARGHRMKGSLDAYLGDFQGAIDEYDTAIGLYPFGPFTYRSRAIAHYRANEFKNALSDLEKSLKINPNSSTALSYAALMHELLGDSKGADEIINRALDRDVSTIPTSECYLNSGRIKLHRNLVQEALDDARQALKLNEYNADACQLAGECLDRLGNKIEAQNYLGKAKNLGYPGYTTQMGL